jgi:hypothetical protein
MGRKLNTVVGRTAGMLYQGTVTASLVSYYTCPNNTTAIITLSLTNRTASPIAVRVNLSTTGSENLGGYIEYDSSIAAYQTLEKNGIILSGGQQILILGTTNITYVISGYDTTAPTVLQTQQPDWANLS